MKINFSKSISSVSETLSADKNDSFFVSDLYPGVNIYAQRAKNIIENGRLLVAENLSVRPGEIVFANDNRQVWEMLFRIAEFKNINHLITAETESEQFLDALYKFTAFHKIKLTFVEFNPEKRINLQALKAVLESSENTLLYLSHLSLYTGTLLPLKKLSKICKETQTFWALDISTSFPLYIINLSESNCDFSFFTSFSIYSKQSIKPVYIKQSFICDEDFEKLFFAKKREINTSNIISIKAIKNSLNERSNSIDENLTRIQDLKLYFYESIKKQKQKINIINPDDLQSPYINLGVNYNPYWRQKFDIKGIALDVLPGENKKYFYFSKQSILNISLNARNTNREIDFFIETLIQQLD